MRKIENYGSEEGEACFGGGERLMVGSMRLRRKNVSKVAGRKDIGGQTHKKERGSNWKKKFFRSKLMAAEHNSGSPASRGEKKKKKKNGRIDIAADVCGIRRKARRKNRPKRNRVSCARRENRATGVKRVNYLQFQKRGEADRSRGPTMGQNGVSRMGVREKSRN